VPFGRSAGSDVLGVCRGRRHETPPRFGGTVCAARCRAPAGAIYARLRCVSRGAHDPIQRRAAETSHLFGVWRAERHRCSSDRGTGSIDGTAERTPRCPRRGNNSLRSPTMRKILGTAVLAISLIGGATVVLAQSSRDLTEPTGTQANRIRTKTGGGYADRDHRAEAH